jgi:hypothetical protein
MRFRRSKEGLMGIRPILEKALKKFDLEIRIKEGKIWEVWDNVVGSTVARNAQPESIRGRVLFVIVSSSAWMQQLQFLKEKIIEKLNQSLGKTLVKSISFRLGTLPSTDPVESEPKKESPPSLDLDQESLKKIEETVSSLRDEATKDLVKSLMVKEAKFKKFRRGRE